jgi:hypothetical protein
MHGQQCVRECGKKFDIAGEATDENIIRMAHGLCMLDSQGYRHTLRISNTFAFPLQQWLNKCTSTVTLYVHCLVVSVTQYMCDVRCVKVCERDVMSVIQGLHYIHVFEFRIHYNMLIHGCHMLVTYFNVILVLCT